MLYAAIIAAIAVAAVVGILIGGEHPRLYARVDNAAAVVVCGVIGAAALVLFVTAAAVFIAGGVIVLIFKRVS